MANISKRTQKTLNLIREGKFYRKYDSNNPATIKELEDAGLIVGTGRVVVVELCYVPTTGYTGYIPEQYENESQG